MHFISDLTKVNIIPSIPEQTSTGRKRRRKQKPLQIIFPKPVRRLRANPEYIDRARSAEK
ncbi:MAG: hypothetical protein IBX40_11115 [Methanosarcinales archaeon]|nr:hypothetical protein [Methanosarcinales archaeon]